jgi:hypothetical protein
MAVPFPSISCCVLNHHNLFYQIQNTLAFNRDTCCHLALCLLLLPIHCKLECFVEVTKICGTVVEHSTRNPEIEGLIPAMGTKSVYYQKEQHVNYVREWLL